ncbi:MAG: hypothetical protein JWP66_1543 [Naasia sp.]|nr:hypothetical protein [Naasia sp.]
MKRISYADEHLLTSAAVADALLQYAKGLAQAGSSDVVSIPTLHGGAPRQAELIIGPASQITALDTTDPERELPGEAEAVDELRRRAFAMHAPAQPVAFEELDVLPDVDGAA